MSAAFFRDGLDEMMHAARAGFDGVGVTEHAQANYDVSPNSDRSPRPSHMPRKPSASRLASTCSVERSARRAEPLRVAEEYR